MTTGTKFPVVMSAGAMPGIGQAVGGVFGRVVTAPKVAVPDPPPRFPKLLRATLGTLIASGIIGSCKPFTRSTGDQVSGSGCAPSSQRQGGVVLVQVPLKKGGEERCDFQRSLYVNFSCARATGHFRSGLLCSFSAASCS